MLFKDDSTGERGKRFLLSVSEEELKLLREMAKRKGVHVAVLVRRALRMTLIEKPDLFNLFS